MLRFKRGILVGFLVFTLVLAGCAGAAPAEPEEPVGGPAEIKGSILLATTTSTQDSGLLDFLIPQFTYDTGWEVDVVAVGSGAAMKMGMDGEADVLLVHSPKAEREFITEGHGPERYDVMYNDFVIIGPESDPAGILGSVASGDAAKAFARFAETQSIFVSRGDDSGTHAKEKTIWAKAGIEPAGDWYVEAGQGMGAVITMANDMQGYTLSDRATWYSYQADTDMMIVTEEDPAMFNQYGVIVVDPAKNSSINAEGALDFQTWMIGESAQALIGEFGAAEFGGALFVPNATGEPTTD